MHLFTLWMGLNLCELLASFAGVAPGLKWPNDLYYGERKVGGMLTEARIDADHTRDLVFGLGLNVNTPDSAWPREIAPRATTLAREAGHPLDLNQLAASIVGRVLAAYDRFLARAPLDEVADLWSHHDILAGRRITVVQGSATHTGIARGIDNEGHCCVPRPAAPCVSAPARVTLRKGSPAPFAPPPFPAGATARGVQTTANNHHG
ncbi:MAG: biotin--[acetyl-CoA-carboxylase] ligase [Opitutaceae bacterium]|nr:biotin--[acetyl-CoA-carboxylase] ligase [Opitutaceae bacterium]